MISHIANLAIVLLLGLTSIVLMGVDTKGAQFGCDGISAVMRSHYEFTSIQTSPQNSNSSAQEEKPVAVNHAYIGKEVDTKVIISKKPRPKYTKAARANKVEGTVVLKVVFSSTGEVNNIHTVTGLPFGLTERAIEAAHKIKFKPAIKDGRPVSMWVQLEYNFNLD
jgi:TonB family protein